MPAAIGPDHNTDSPLYGGHRATHTPNTPHAVVQDDSAALNWVQVAIAQSDGRVVSYFVRTGCSMTDIRNFLIWSGLNCALEFGAGSRLDGKIIIHGR